MRSANTYEKATFALMLILTILSIAIFVKVNSLYNKQAVIVGKASYTVPQAENAEINHEGFAVLEIPDECLSEPAPEECDNITQYPWRERNFTIVENDDVMS